MSFSEDLDSKIKTFVIRMILFISGRDIFGLKKNFVLKCYFGEYMCHFQRRSRS